MAELDAFPRPPPGPAVAPPLALPTPFVAGPGYTPPTQAASAAQPIDVPRPPPPRPAPAAAPADQDERSMIEQGGWAGASEAIASLMADYRTTPLQMISGALGGYNRGSYAAKQDAAERRFRNAQIKAYEAEANQKQLAYEQGIKQRAAVQTWINKQTDPVKQEQYQGLFDAGQLDRFGELIAPKPRDPMKVGEGEVVYDPATQQQLFAGPPKMASPGELLAHQDRVAGLEFEQWKAQHPQASPGELLAHQDRMAGLELDRWKIEHPQASPGEVLSHQDRMAELEFQKSKPPTSEELISVDTPSGPMLVPRSQAAGKRPGSVRDLAGTEGERADKRFLAIGQKAATAGGFDDISPEDRGWYEMEYRRRAAPKIGVDPANPGLITTTTPDMSFAPLPGSLQGGDPVAATELPSPPPTPAPGPPPQGERVEAQQQASPAPGVEPNIYDEAAAAAAAGTPAAAPPLPPPPPSISLPTPESMAPGGPPRPQRPTLPPVSLPEAVAPAPPPRPAAPPPPPLKYGPTAGRTPMAQGATKEQITDFNKALTARNDMATATGRMRELLNEGGGQTALSGDLAARFKVGSQQVVTALGALGNAGVLQPSDIDRFTSMFGDPTSLTGYFGNMTGLKPLGSALDELDKVVSGRMGSRAREAGLPVFKDDKEAEEGVKKLAPGQGFVGPDGLYYRKKGGN